MPIKSIKWRYFKQLLKAQLSAVLAVNHVRPVACRCALTQELTACFERLVQTDAAMTVEQNDIKVILNKALAFGNNTHTLQHSRHAEHGTAGVLCLNRCA